MNEQDELIVSKFNKLLTKEIIYFFRYKKELDNDVKLQINLINELYTCCSNNGTLDEWHTYIKYNPIFLDILYYIYVIYPPSIHICQLMLFFINISSHLYIKNIIKDKLIYLTSYKLIKQLKEKEKDFETDKFDQLVSYYLQFIVKIFEKDQLFTLKEEEEEDGKEEDAR